MSVPLVTVVMSVQNAVSTLESALRSILWQTFPDWELIVVDDGSTDWTGRLLSQVSDARVQVVWGEGGQKGLATRLNQCIGLARGKYVARMDADDVAYPERFERQVKYLEGHPDVDLLGHGAVLFRGQGQIVGVYPSAQTHEEIGRWPWWGFPLAHPTWMGRRSWFLGHPYNERLTKGQDQELLLRSFRTSRFAALPDILLGYRIVSVSAAISASGRIAYCRQLLVQVRDLPSALMAVRGMAVHGVALLRDLVLNLTGTMSQNVRRSFRSADEFSTRQWEIIWNRLGVEQDRQG